MLEMKARQCERLVSVQMQQKARENFLEEGNFAKALGMKAYKTGKGGPEEVNLASVADRCHMDPETGERSWSF